MGLVWKNFWVWNSKFCSRSKNLILSISGPVIVWPLFLFVCCSEYRFLHTVVKPHSVMGHPASVQKVNDIFLIKFNRHYCMIISQSIRHRSTIIMRTEHKKPHSLVRYGVSLISPLYPHALLKINGIYYGIEIFNALHQTYFGGNFESISSTAFFKSLEAVSVLIAPSFVPLQIISLFPAR